MDSIHAIHKFSITFFIVLLFLSSGCIDFSGSSDSEYMFVGGDEALRIDFVGNNPPERIFQNREFDIALLVQNRGETAVNAGDVQFRLNGARQLGVSCDATACDSIKTNSETLSAVIRAGDGYIPGSAEYVMYEDLKYVGRNVLTEESPLALSIESCYPYKTVSVSDICITTSTESTVCNFLEEKEVHNSGGPIRVKSVEQQGNFIEGDVVYAQVRIEFEQTGEGDVYDAGTACNALTIDSLNRITLESLTIGGADPWTGGDIIKMCGQKEFRLDDGEVFTVCEIPVENPVSEYEERFVIVLGYKHTQLITKDISVMPARWS